MNNNLIKNVNVVIDPVNKKIDDINARLNAINPNIIGNGLDANGHSYVEIGGIRWATCNIGAKNPWDQGSYFMWGDTLGYSGEEVAENISEFSWQWYSYSIGNSSPSEDDMSKYNNIDNLTTLEHDNDSASENFGGAWRMPTAEEILSLFNCTNQLVADYKGTGVGGVVFFELDQYGNDKELFIPYNEGWIKNGSFTTSPDSVYLWTSSLHIKDEENENDTDGKECAEAVRIGSGPSGIRAEHRICGFQIRPVLNGPYTLNITDQVNANTANIKSLEESKANASDIPTKLSDLTNDANYVTASESFSGSYMDLTNVPSFPLTNAQRRLIGFEESFYSVKKGRTTENDTTSNYYKHGIKWYNRFCLLHFSDVHQYCLNNTKGRYDSMGEVIKMAQGKADLMCCTGDIADGIKDTNSNNTAELNEAILLAAYQHVVDAVEAANTGNVKILITDGNCDNVLSSKESFYNKIEPLVHEYSSNFVYGDATNKSAYGYLNIDFNTIPGTNGRVDKFKIIVLDMLEYDNSNGSNNTSRVFTQTQLDNIQQWLNDAVTEDRYVITMGHYPFAKNNSTPNYDVPYADCTGSQEFAIADMIEGTTGLKYICHLYGHMHAKSTYRCTNCDNSGSVTKQYDILMLGESSLSDKGTAINNVYHESFDGTQGGVQDVSCSMLCIDVIEQCIYRVNYGAYIPCDGTTAARIEKIPYTFTNSASLS